MKVTLALSLVTALFIVQVRAHSDHALHHNHHHHLHLRSPGMPDNNNSETPKENLGEQELGRMPGAVTPATMPQGLGSTFCPTGMGFCGSRDACCSMGGLCCLNGGCCNEPGAGCFPDKDGKTHCCQVATEKLCTSRTCIPKNAVCCKNGTYCAAGTYCVKGGCCKAGMICKQKTGAKSGGHDSRAYAPQKIKAPPV